MAERSTRYNAFWGTRTHARPSYTTGERRRSPATSSNAFESVDRALHGVTTASTPLLPFACGHSARLGHWHASVYRHFSFALRPRSRTSASRSEGLGIGTSSGETVPRFASAFILDPLRPPARPVRVEDESAGGGEVAQAPIFRRATLGYNTRALAIINYLSESGSIDRNCLNLSASSTVIKKNGTAERMVERTLLDRNIY